jgi:hypothetical protein
LAWPLALILPQPQLLPTAPEALATTNYWRVEIPEVACGLDSIGSMASTTHLSSSCSIRAAYAPPNAEQRDIRIHGGPWDNAFPNYSLTRRSDWGILE